MIDQIRIRTESTNRHVKNVKSSHAHSLSLSLRVHFSWPYDALAGLACSCACGGMESTRLGARRMALRPALAAGSSTAAKLSSAVGELAEASAAGGVRVAVAVAVAVAVDVDVDIAVAGVCIGKSATEAGLPARPDCNCAPVPSDRDRERSDMSDNEALALASIDIEDIALVLGSREIERAGRGG